MHEFRPNPKLCTKQSTIFVSKVQNNKKICRIFHSVYNRAIGTSKNLREVGISNLAGIIYQDLKGGWGDNHFPLHPWFLRPCITSTACMQSNDTT